MKNLKFIQLFGDVYSNFQLFRRKNLPVDNSVTAIEALENEEITNKSTEPKKRVGVRTLWPILFTFTIVSITYSIYIININLLSNFFWPGVKFDVHSIQMGVSLTSRAWMWALSGIIFGNIADRFSRKRLLEISFSIVALAYIFNAFLPMAQGTHSFIYFTIGNGLAGLGIGGIRPIMLSLTNDHLEKDEKSHFFGTYYALNQIAGVIGMILSSFLFEMGYWKIFHLSIGAFLILGIILVDLFVKEPKRGQRSHEKLAKLLEKTNMKYNYKMTKKTFRSTILTTTNVLALLEGIFTCILFDIIIFLVVPYLENAPYNIGASSMSLLFIIFALPGAFIGSIAFSKLSDKLGKKNIKNRLLLITLSITGIITAFILAFNLPLPKFTVSQGKNIVIILQNPLTWILGSLIFVILSLNGIYSINQPPVLQAINLPETQGFISSLNQSLEIFASGMAPLIGGVLINVLNGNYHFVAILSGIIGIPGAIMWFYARFKIDKDIANINSILQNRAIEMESQNEESKKKIK
ncbi:MAG: MFS transporter [Promethearchaeota archaeon]